MPKTINTTALLAAARAFLTAEGSTAKTAARKRFLLAEKESLPRLSKEDSKVNPLFRAQFYLAFYS